VENEETEPIIEDMLLDGEREVEGLGAERHRYDED
jgi:hypothetical protein